MFLENLLDLIRHEKRKQVRVETAQEFAIGMGIVATAGAALGIIYASKSEKGVLENMKKKISNISESIKETVQNGSKTVQDTAEHAAQKVCDAVDNADNKSEVVNKNMKRGIHEVSQDIHKTAEAISKGLNKL